MRGDHWAAPNFRPGLKQTYADRIARSLKRLGFQLSRVGRTFKVVDKAGTLAAGSRPVMTLEEIKRWIAAYIELRS